MLLVLDPSIEQFGVASLLPAIAAVISAIADLMTRRMSVRETSLSFVVSTALGAIAVGLCTIGFGWRWPDAPSVALVSLAGVFVLLAHYFIAEAFRSAPAFYVSPFRYSALVWGLLISSVVWRQTPDLTVLAGSGVLIGAGLYLASGR